MTLWRCPLRKLFLNSWSIFRKIFTTESNKNEVAHTTLLKSFPVMRNFLEIILESNKNFSVQETPLTALFLKLTNDANSSLVLMWFLLPYNCNKISASQGQIICHHVNCTAPLCNNWPTLIYNLLYFVTQKSCTTLSNNVCPTL